MEKLPKIRFLLFILSLIIVRSAFADSVIWHGEVNSNGSPTSSIKLDLGKKYQLKVSGSMNLGKWWQQGKPLADDACYEYHELVTPIPIDTFKNSMHISVGDGKYHPDHIYWSKPFVAVQSGIHFWIYDTNYGDNSGALHVELIELTEKKE